ncbi:hypothetical protein P171DRAFT_430228 [Karstenula rhodostoma CBS 690.94]|uniref:RING-type domain-containing protein n=1 Tax=Karstenula rhodostoma CBS 690.94 TaxID=1392251 RepID=A0A9P4PNJ1_9PLEO|nr:hypothetical protein P171DRAFT_430228 [Karstenula rhodostoma CBS 690.94]
MHTTSGLHKKLLADVQLRATLTTRALRSGRDDKQESELLADFAYQMQVSMDIFNDEVKRQTGSLAGTTETEKLDDNFGPTLTKSTLLTVPRMDLPANNPKPARRRRADSFSLTRPSTSESDNTDATSPTCKPPPVDHPVSTVITSSPPKPVNSSPVVDPTSPESLQHARCPFCKRPPEHPNLTSCGHIVCCFCVGEEIDKAYEFGRHPTCPACLSEISRVTPLRYL